MNEAKPAVSPARRARRWLVDIGLLVAVLLAVQAWLTRDVVRGPLPTLQAPMVGGSGFVEWRRAHVADGFVLYVWASWCPICKTIQGSVDAVARQAPVLTVAMQSGSVEAVSAFLAERNLRWPTLVDADGALSRQLGVASVPTLLFVDRQGDVRAVTQGYTTEIGIRMRLWWIRTIG